MTDQTPVGVDDIARQMRLRPNPPPVMRLSRKALMAIAGVSALALTGALAFALIERPAKKANPELYRTGAPPPETLQSLPQDYSGSGRPPVPQLGSPLPGDLGRPILAAQNQEVDVAPPPMGDATSLPDAAQSSADAARQRAMQERDAARTSTLFLSGAGASRSSEPGKVGQPDTAPSVKAPDSLARTLSAPPSPFTLQAGAVIPGALITGLRSDLPGSAIGQVTDDVYDSVAGRYLLIPKGSRLLGAYEADVAFGQSRLTLVWSRLILPDGRSIDLEDLRATDPEGYSGLEDRTHNRWGERLRTAALSTLLAVGASAGVSSGDDAVARALTQGVSGGVNAFGQGLVEKGLGVPPRLTIRPGFAFRVIVARDLVLTPYGDYP